MILTPKEELELFEAFKGRSLSKVSHALDMAEKFRLKRISLEYRLDKLIERNK